MDEETLKNQKKKVGKLKALYDTDGGKVLVSALVLDIANAVKTISAQYKVLTHEEFVALGAEIHAKLGVARSLVGAKKNEEFINSELEELLLNQ